MRNIFKETDELLEKYGSTNLEGKSLVLYQHNKKSLAAAFLYFLLVINFGLPRFYMGDRFSKIYAFVFLFLSIFIWLNLVLEWITIDNLNISLTIESLYAVLLLIDLFLVVPIIKRNNLILKKNIIENIDSVKDRGSYRWQEYLALILLLLLNWF